MRVNIKKVRERVVLMNDAWRQLAASNKFMGVSQTDFDAKITAAKQTEQEIEDFKAQIKAKEITRDAQYGELNTLSVRVREGVEGDATFGPDSPLYAAMGFIIESMRKSGLTRKKKTPEN